MSGRCEVCSTGEYKYKCPTCTIKYCSVGCFSTHRDSCIPPVQTTKEDSGQNGDAFNPEYKFQTTETVPIDKLQLLGSSGQLKHLLKNQHLQAFLKTLDEAENPPRLMRKAMREPLFIEFVDECLKIIEPTSQQLSDKQVLEAIQKDFQDQE